MTNFGGLVLELFLLLGIPIIIPIIITFVAGQISYNYNIKNKIGLILSFICNAIIGFFSPIIFFCVVLSGFLSKIFLYFVICLIFGIIIIPINIYIIKKFKANKMLYIILNFIVFILGCVISTITIRGSIDL